MLFPRWVLKKTYRVITIDVNTYFEVYAYFSFLTHFNVDCENVWIRKQQAYIATRKISQQLLLV